MASKTLTTIEDLGNTLSSQAFQKQFHAALPDHISPKRFVRIAITAVRNEPKLLNCTRPSLFSAFMKAAQDGLLPDGEEAAIVPYGKEAEYMPMIAGILKKIRNSGELKSMSPKVVHEKDHFEEWTDENGDHLMFKPLQTGDRGKIIKVFVVTNTKDGGVYIDVMTVDEIEAVRKMSKNAKGPAWTNSWGEMAKKTVIRRQSKRLPKSTDIEMVVKRIDDDYDFSEPEPVTVEKKEPKPAKRTRKVIDAKKVEEKPAEQPAQPVEVTPEEEAQLAQGDEDVIDTPI